MINEVMVNASYKEADVQRERLLVACKTAIAKLRELDMAGIRLTEITDILKKAVADAE